MNSKNRIALGSILILALTPLAAVQAGEQGFYIGGSVGQSQIKASESDITLPEPEDTFTFDETDTAWKLLAGYRWKLGNSFNLGLEGAYVNLGKPTFTDTEDQLSLELEATGFTGFGVASFALGPVDLFGKLGFIAWDGDATVTDLLPPGGSLSDDESGTDVAYGVGGQWNIGSLGLRLEYESYEISDVDRADMWTVGATWQF